MTATPKNRRQKDVFGGLPRPATLTAADEPDEIPPSSAFRVPSSIQRLPGPQKNDKEPRLPRPYLQTAIEQTPTRGPSKQSLQLSGTGPSNGTSSISLTPSKTRRALDSIPQGSRRTNTYAVQPSTLCTQEPGNRESKVLETPRKDQVGGSEQDRSSVPVVILSDTPPRNFIPNIRGGPAATFPSSPPVPEPEASKSLFETLGWDDYVDELS